MNQNLPKDVIIVGAGMAGLIAAQQLVTHGLDVQIVEANERIGGRVHDYRSTHGDTFPLGATWFGPYEEKMHALMAELGLETEMQYEAGDIVTRIHGQQRIVKNNKDVRVGPIPLPSDMLPDDFLNAIATLEALAEQVPLDDPYAHPQAAVWDNLTVAEWYKTQTTTELGATLLHMILEGAMWTELEEISFLFLLYHWRALGAQIVDDRRVRGGPMQIINWLAGQLDGRIHLRAPVIAMAQDKDGVRVQTADKTFTARYVIVAIPPPLCQQITFQPPLPPARQQLSRDMQMSKVIKVFVTYETPFWREVGLSGMVLTDEEPLESTFDGTPEGSTHGTLISFLTGWRAQVWHERPPAERKMAILQQLAQLFGSSAATPLAYIEQDWLAEPWSGGCYCGVMPPNTMAHYGSALRDPVGRIHWAGTETATMWYGSMEGAILSGERAVAEVLARLREGAMNVGR